MRILAVDPGEKHIGLAVSDPTGTVARPLTTLAHTARADDAARIAALAEEHAADMILVGLALDSAGEAGAQGRRAERLAEALREVISCPVSMFDESFSTQAANAARRGRRKKRRPLADTHAVAAAAILQSYLDAHARRDSAA